MARKIKEELEKEMIALIKDAGGIKTYGSCDDNGHCYWFFNTNDGRRMYWTNLSEDGKKALGIGE